MDFNALKKKIAESVPEKFRDKLGLQVDDEDEEELDEDELDEDEEDDEDDDDEEFDDDRGTEKIEAGDDDDEDDEDDDEDDEEKAKAEQRSKIIRGVVIAAIAYYVVDEYVLKEDPPPQPPVVKKTAPKKKPKKVVKKDDPAPVKDIEVPTPKPKISEPAVDDKISDIPPETSTTTLGLKDDEPLKAKEPVEVAKDPLDTKIPDTPNFNDMFKDEQPKTEIGEADSGMGESKPKKDPDPLMGKLDPMKDDKKDDLSDVLMKKVEEKKDYVAPPDYQKTGRGLVYNCKEKHWACVNKFSYFQCHENEKFNKNESKPMECVIADEVYATTKDCIKVQQYYVNIAKKITKCD